MSLKFLLPSYFSPPYVIRSFQINYGISLEQASSQCTHSLSFAKLNEKAGVEAMICSDYATACSYMNTALKWLPPDHWRNHYDLRLE